MRKLKIAIATGGRFHVLDLARELDALGLDVRFYSYVPLRRAKRFGLPEHCHRSLLPFVAPVLLWERLAPNLAPRLREWLMFRLLNWAVMLKLEPCDVFICMSGVYVEAPAHAKRRFGARIWLERGSRHILSQDEILAAIPGAERPSALAIRRELEGYALADRIVIPSSHVEESFRRDPVAHAKLFVNPYGVDLAMFPCRNKKKGDGLFTFLFVGTWSFQKGVDILTKVIKQLSNVRLLHVGTFGDAPFPLEDNRFIHIDAVPQRQLAKHYGSADAFVLASRQDGFGMVLAQALASGLPVVCTDRSGGADLAHTPTLAARIVVVENGNVEALEGAMASMAARSGPYPEMDEDDRRTLSWSEYARRYECALCEGYERAQDFTPIERNRNETNSVCPRLSI